MATRGGRHFAALSSFLYRFIVDWITSSGPIFRPSASLKIVVREGLVCPSSNLATNVRVTPDANANPSWLSVDDARRALISAAKARSRAGSWLERTATNLVALHHLCTRFYGTKLNLSKRVRGRLGQSVASIQIVKRLAIRSLLGNPGHSSPMSSVAGSE